MNTSVKTSGIKTKSEKNSVASYNYFIVLIGTSRAELGLLSQSFI